MHWEKLRRKKLPRQPENRLKHPRLLAHAMGFQRVYTSQFQKRYLQSDYAVFQKRYPQGYYAANGVNPAEGAPKCSALYRQERCHVALSLHRFLFSLDQFAQLHREIYPNKRHISPLYDLYEQITPERNSYNC